MWIWYFIQLSNILILSIQKRFLNRRPSSSWYNAGKQKSRLQRGNFIISIFLNKTYVLLGASSVHELLPIRSKAVMLSDIRALDDLCQIKCVIYFWQWHYRRFTFDKYTSIEVDSIFKVCLFSLYIIAFYADLLWNNVQFCKINQYCWTQIYRQSGHY